MPNFLKVVAVAGIAVNTMALAIGYPLEFFGYFYGLFGEEPWALSYSLADRVSWFVNIPLAFILIIASVGLLNRKEWGRRGCVIGLAISIAWGFVWFFSNLTQALATSGDALGELLIGAPIMLLATAFEVIVLIYLNGASVREHMNGSK